MGGLKGKWLLSAGTVLLVFPAVQAIAGVYVEQRSFLDIFNPAYVSRLFLVGLALLCLLLLQLVLADGVE